MVYGLWPLYLTIGEADRYEVKFEGGRYDTVAWALIPLESGCLNPAPRSDEVVKLKEENLMYSAMREKEVKEQKAHAALSKILILVGGADVIAC